MTDAQWNGHERREYQKTIRDVEEAFGRALTEHEAREKRNVESIIEALKADIVPGGDLRPHRDYHQAKIDAAHAERDFWLGLKKDMAKTGLVGLWGVILILLGLAITGLMVKLGLRPLP